MVTVTLKTFPLSQMASHTTAVYLAFLGSLRPHLQQVVGRTYEKFTKRSDLQKNLQNGIYNKKFKLSSRDA